MNIEDVMPMLSNSNDNNPIEIHGITAMQFRDYLLILLGRPYDKEYSKLISYHNYFITHSKDICVRYLDIATLARRFRMVELEQWTIDALRTSFTGPTTTLAKIASENWDCDTVLKLRAFTKATKIELPVLTFIQYLVSVGSKDEAIAASGDHIDDIPCVGLYRNFKESDIEPVLFGCAFLNILSLGHRSPVWAGCLTRNDRAILYAAQAQLVNASEGLGLDLGWLSAPRSATPGQLCDKCSTRLLEKWNRSFGQCSKDLGSGYPLKDVSLLAQLPTYRHIISSGWGSACKQNSRCVPTLLGSVDTHIQQVFTKATSHYKKVVEEL
ncbi:unnamed protein product [Rhizoctonia solani]|uniref:BTB domain-containing protein n=1 Tax=Rhizoctonia solani TaxID=456999 RepID=A0A8H3GRW5_9AGAM|nr:unnamed protein product [Rhizoctonia solani]CAE6462877.1 unnamed protein product [Rhizoctonia solani]